MCFKPICFHLTLRPRGEETMMTLNEFFDPDVDLNFFWNEKHADTFLFIMVIVESNPVCNHACD